MGKSRGRSKGREKRPDEFELIRRFFAPLAAKAPGAFGLTDDAATVAVAPGRRLIVTTDALVAGVHFPEDESPQSVAARLIGVNLSDLAAMGATPEAYTMAIALPKNCDLGWIKAFADELGRLQKTHHVTLIGGDTVATGGPLTVCLTALGSVAKGREIRRNGARAGDLIYISGTIGDATLGLKVMQDGIAGLGKRHAKTLVGRYRRPQPRVRLGLGLVGLATAAIDVSDGLIADLGHVAQTSRCTAEIDVERVPLSAAARAAIALDPRLRERTLTGGDDYELAFTARPSHRNAVAALARQVRLPLTEIGRMRRARKDSKGGARLVDVRDGAGHLLPIVRTGYRHF
ncbi:MAG: thiamine-phosphate kinase [Rhodospirillales bacterium]|nr:thiamine-phosphate kinase [Rhodospirillales bacterium]